MHPMTRTALWPRILALTALLEGAAVFCRFGLGWSSTKATAGTVGLLTFGIRIHHGYFGVLLLPTAWALRKAQPAWAQWAFIAGMALILSDLIHHFLVLWPITGSPQWDWVYPAE